MDSWAFPDPVISWAGLGPSADLCWWIAGPLTSAERSVRAARCEGASLRQLGTIEPVGRQVVARIARNGSALLVASGELLHRLPLDPAGSAPESFPLGESDVSDLDSADGRIVYLARALRWPPIRRFDTGTSAHQDLESRQHSVSKHHPVLALSPDGRHMAFGHVFDALEVFDLAAGTSVPWPSSRDELTSATLRDSDMIARMSYTSDGGHLFAISHPRSESPGAHPVLRLGSADGRDVSEIRIERHLPTVSIAPGGRLAAAPRRGASTLVDVFEPRTGVVLKTVEIGHHVMGIHLNPHEGTLTVVHAAGLMAVELELP